MENRKTIKIIVAALIAALLLAGACAVMGRFITPLDAADGNDAAAAIAVAGKAGSIEGGVKMARESIDSGAAMEKLATLIKFSNQR